MSLDIWAVWPTVHVEKSKDMIEVWRGLGYNVAVLLDAPHVDTELPRADLVIVQEEWRGFPVAVNNLCREVPGDIVVVVGDDVLPDPNLTAQEIGGEMISRFPKLDGVFQPIGDVYGWTHKCAVSPWIGRRFIEEAYGGKAGPFWPGYYHYFSDQELQEYAMSLGRFQQSSDITQYHDHWQRRKGEPRPPHLRKAKRLWRKDKALFESRKREGWPHGTI